VRLYAAIDAVRDPATGAIVCRVSLTNPGLYPGCTPFNILGQGAASREAVEYVFGANSQYRAVTTLDDVSFNLAGEAFTLPAGPVSVAMGMEHRRQALKLTSNASPSAPLVTTGIRAFPMGLGRFGNTNVGVADGASVVDEAYGEVVLPLVRDLPWLKMLEFNGALRVTNYSESGRVETYKAGFNYLATDSLRLRATLSRDIRAPTLYEQFAGASLNTQPLTDSHTGVSSSITTVTQGAPDLTPEIGYTSTVGVVWRPAWLPGFNGSVDYYDIEIKDAIGATTALELNEECEASGGTAPACAFIQRPFPFSNRTPANMVQRIQITPLNLAQVYTHGFDIEAGYRFATRGFGAGEAGLVDLRLLANYAPTRKTRQSPDSPPREEAGVGGVANSGLTANPKWRSLISLRYDEGPWSVNLQERIVGKMVRSNQPDVVFTDNVLGAVYYTDLDLRRDFEVEGRRLTAFVTINNLWDREPPLVPNTREPGLIFPSLQTIYDVIGRYYTAGVQLRF
jgi:iron complex outermembrane receptor protein